MRLLLLKESMGMKKYMLVVVLGLVVVASVAYARRGASSVFTFASHPLAGYGDQIIEIPEVLEAAEAGGGLDLFE